MTFDPRKYREKAGDDQGGGDRDDRPLPAGTYMLAMTWFKRGQAKDGADMLRAKFTCIYGAAKGRSFFAPVSLNFRKAGAAGRFAAWCACVGNEDPIDERKDAAIRSRFAFRPFKAKVSAKQEEYKGETRTQNDIDRFVPEMTDEERAFAAAWFEEQAAEREAREASRGAALSDAYHEEPDDPGPSDDDAPPDRGRRRSTADDDDSIPF